MLREIKETLLEEFHLIFFLITEQVGANFESIEKQEKKLYHGVSGFESWFSSIPWPFSYVIKTTSELFTIKPTNLRHPNFLEYLYLM